MTAKHRWTYTICSLCEAPQYTDGTTIYCSEGCEKHGTAFEPAKLKEDGTK